MVNILGVPIIVALVYAIIELLKLTFKDKTEFLNFIPLLSGVLGCIFCIIAFYAVPNMIPATNIFEAMLGGIISGLSATGSHQVIKQIKDLMNNKVNKL